MYDESHACGAQLTAVISVRPCLPGYVKRETSCQSVMAKYSKVQAGGYQSYSVHFSRS